MNRVALRILSLIVALMMLSSASGCGRSAKKSLERGVAALRAGRIREAVVLLEKARSVDPENASVNANLGIAYWKNGKPEEALLSLKKAAELEKQDPRPLEFQGEILTAQQDWEGARKVLKEALKREKNSPRIITALGVVEMHAGKLYKGYESFMTAVDIDPDYPPALYNLAILYRDRLPNKADIAAKYFRRYVTAMEQAMAGRPGAQLSPLDKGRIDAAQKFLLPDTTAAGVEQVNPIVAAARDAAKAGEADRAIILLKNGIQDYPDDPDILWGLAKMYESLQNTENAKQTFDVFKRVFPDDSRARALSGDEQTPDISGDSAAADESTPLGSDSAELSAGQKKDLAQAAWEKATELYQKKDLVGAIKAYEEALANDANSAQIWHQYGMALMQNQQYTEAKKAFEKALLIQPDNVDARWRLARTCTHLNEDNRAIDEFSRALRREPECVPANYYLGLAYMKVERFNMARKYLDDCVKLEPDGYYGKKAADLIVKLDATLESARPDA